MKIRIGHVSNSSSCSFTLPSFALTDEQKEILLFVDDGERAELYEKIGIKIDPIDYPKNKDYHRTYDEMLKNDWGDSGWTIQENKKLNIVHGSTMMGNGSIQELMEKIGINLTILQSTNHGHCLVRMATNPQAVKHFIWLHKKELEQWNGLSDKEKELEKRFKPLKKSPYALRDEEFKPFGEDSLEYEPEPEDDYQETYCYIKDKKK